MAQSAVLADAAEEKWTRARANRGKFSPAVSGTPSVAQGNRESEILDGSSWPELVAATFPRGVRQFD
jgi:hypothetical protein